MENLRIVVGIPALNEEGTIAKIVLRSQEHAERVLVVDDGSQDDTALIAEKLGAVVLRHGKSLGKGAGLRDCFEWARQNGADLLVTLDSDGQHNPGFIPRLIEELNSKKADVVIASRVTRPRDMPRYRWLGERALDMTTQVKVDGRVVDAQSGFRAYSRKAIETLVAAEFGMGADAEIIMRADRAGMRIVEVPVAATYAGLSTSSQHPIMHGLDVLFSVIKFISIRHPLLFYGGFGLVALVNSLVFGVITLDYYRRYGVVVTNPALLSLTSGIVGFLAIFTGVILYTLITVIREKQ